MKQLCLSLLFFFSGLYFVHGQCTIDNLIVEAHACTPNGIFYVDLDFNYDNVGSSGFTVQGNGNNYGTFNYSDLYITLGPFVGDGTTVYEFVVTDNDDPNCSEWTTIGPIDCSNTPPCDFTNIHVDTLGCNPDGTYGIELDFDYSNMTNDYFEVFDENGGLIDYYLFTDLPVTINHFPASGQDFDILTICENDNPNCCVTFTFAAPDCNSGGNCHIYDLIVEAHPCTPNGIFYVDLDFNYDNVGSSGFTVQGNGNNYGTFNYSDLYITLGPFVGDGTTVYEFVVTDNDDPNCSEWTTIGPIDCSNTPPCDFTNIHVDTLGCNPDGTYGIELDFDYSNMTNDYFEVFDENGGLIDYYLFTDLPVTINHFPASGQDFDILTICENDNPNCCVTFTFAAPDCSGFNCEIQGLKIDPHPCEDNQFMIDVEFEVINNGNGGFTIQGNGNNYGTFDYDFTELTLGPFPGDNNTIYEFVISDVDYPACSDWKEVGPVDCLLNPTEELKTDFNFIVTDNFLYLKQKGSNEGEKIMTLFNMTGQKLFVQGFTQELRTNISTLPSGVYLCQVQKGNEFWINKFYIN